MALHSLYCADVPLRNCSLTHSADVGSQPDVSQPSVNGFRCGKVHNLGGRVTN